LQKESRTGKKEKRRSETKKKKKGRWGKREGAVV
jgi:hypothetical protein